MAITMQEIEHLAKLSKLSLSEEEKTRLVGEMQDILAFADKLSTLDTEAAEPTMFAAEGQNVFREDEIRPSLSPEEILKNAPKADMGCFVVPKTVE